MMKKNRQMTNQMKGMLLWVLPLVLVSCGSFQGVSYYGDGIYGEELPVEETEVITYEQQGTSPTYYKSYFNEMAEKANHVVTDYTSFTDVDSYQSATNLPSYAGWGQNTSRENVTINVYDDFNNGWGYDPYYNWNYGNNYYWGMGAWSPYYRSSWGYYGPRNRISFGFGWSSGWNYPYYGYSPYYGYNPYYGYPYYGYYPYYYGGYYPINTVYYNPKNYAYVKGIRRGGGNYENTSNNSRGSYNNSMRRTSNNSYNNHQRRSDSSYTRSYSRNSTGGYTPAQRSSSSYTPSSTERRTYQRNTSSSPVRTSPSSGYSRSYSRNSNTSGYRGARRGD